MKTPPSRPRLPLPALLLAAILALAAAESRAEIDQSGPGWTPVVLATVDGLSDIVADRATGLVYVRAGDTWQIVVGGNRLVPAAEPPAQPPADGLMPQARVVAGTNTIAAAWLADPTWRYAHGVLGDAVEAGTVRVRLSDGRAMHYTLADGFVFEDLTPRLADLDNDGIDEIVLVRSSLTEGAALSAYPVGERRLEQFANSPAVGVPHRWLNPVGIADFDADGEADIAVVETPHLGRQLVIYRRDAARLIEMGRLAGFSNHAAGSTVLGLSAVLDVDGDGVVDMIVPDAARGRLAAVTFRGRRFAILGLGPEGAPIVTSVVLADLDGNGRPDILYGRADGTLAALLR